MDVERGTGSPEVGYLFLLKTKTAVFVSESSSGSDDLMMDQTEDADDTARLGSPPRNGRAVRLKQRYFRNTSSKKQQKGKTFSVFLAMYSPG